MSTEIESKKSGAGNRRVAPSKFAHAVLRTKQFKTMVDWYTTVLEAEVVNSNHFIAFLTYDDEHHRIAIASIPGLTDRTERSWGSTIWRIRTRTSAISSLRMSG